MKNTVKISMIALAAVMAGCSSAPAASASAAASSVKEEGTEPIVVAIANDINTMDSTIATDGSSMNTIAMCQSGLMQWDENGVLQHDLAESYEVSEDGMTYTFHLRPGIEWSDGTPITADDFVYSWRREADPAVASEYNYILSSICVKNAAEVISGELPVEELGVEAVDDSTFVVTLSQPCAFMITMMPSTQFMPLKQEYVESMGDQYALSVDNMLYSGAYVMSDWVEGNSYTFTHNEHYWDAENYPQQEITIAFMQDEQSAMLQYEAGALDVVTITGEMVDAYRNTDGFRNKLTASVWWAAFNFNDPYLTNVNLRKAIAYSIDRETLASYVLNNGAVEADGIVGRGVTVNPEGKDWREVADDYTVYDPEQAGKFYEAAKAEMGGDAVIEIMYDDAGDISKVAENLQQMIQTACPGITVTLQAYPKKTRIQYMLTHDFSMILNRWGPDYADGQSYLDTLLSGSTMNGGLYNNPEYDALMAKACFGEDAADAAKRYEDLIEAERILCGEDYGITPIYQEGSAVMVAPSVTGYMNSVMGMGTWRHMTKTVQE